MSRTNAPLYPSDEKIERAKRKFVDLEASINSYLGSDAYSVRTEIKGNRTYIIARLENDISKDVAFEVVELVGHLRSALDKMVVALVDKNGRGTSGVGFPFSGMDNGKPETFPSDRMETRIKKKLTPDQWSRIAFYEPYPGGRASLWAINEIANTDKHRNELVCIEPSLTNGVTFGVWGRSIVGLSISSGAPQDQAILQDQKRERVLVSYSTTGPDPNINPTITKRIIFANVPPVQRKDVMVTLNQQILLVTDIVTDFKTRFFT